MSTMPKPYGKLLPKNGEPMFGNKKTDQSQDQQLKQLQTDIGNCWSWIQNLDQRLERIENSVTILVKNNNAWLKWIKTIPKLHEKDKQHDAKDVEIEAVINGIKNMAKAVETATATTEEQ